MTTLEDVYLKFGFASEAAQLLETELGNMLFLAGVVDANLLENQNPARAHEILEFVNRQTLGQLLRSLHRSTESLDSLETKLSKALIERNRLSHSFYRQHNFRRNTAEGRATMLDDLEAIHTTILDAYKAVMLLSGIDLDKAVADELPTRHITI